MRAQLCDAPVLARVQLVRGRDVRVGVDHRGRRVKVGEQRVHPVGHVRAHLFDVGDRILGHLALRRVGRCRLRPGDGRGARGLAGDVLLAREHDARAFGVLGRVDNIEVAVAVDVLDEEPDRALAVVGGGVAGLGEDGLGGDLEVVDRGGAEVAGAGGVARVGGAVAAEDVGGAEGRRVLDRRGGAGVRLDLGLGGLAAESVADVEDGAEDGVGGVLAEAEEDVVEAVSILRARTNGA